MISDGQKIQALSNTPLFAGWDEVYLKDIADMVGIDSYQKGDIIFKQDTRGDRFYIIVEGNVIILSPEDNSVLAEFVSGEMFGETAMLTQEEQKAIASANENSIILSFPKDGIPMEDVFKDNPVTYAQLLKSFLVMVSRRTRKANSLIKENSPIMQELQKQVYGDKLTGLLNKAYLEENIADFMKGSFSLIMMKPDNFKAINDTYGHEKGDACLTFIGNHLSHFLDTDSVLIRYQGNEFAVLTPDQGRDGAANLAEKIKAELENLDISPVLNSPFKLSISLGVLLYPDTKIEKTEFIKQCSEMPLIGRARGGSQILFEEDINE
ncbi:GGDEF domain-containing protein [Treponema denticola]|uniref:GGDEF domain-containing protein n=1 Tax=Treponema denticola TaxID=158 RepID=UPI0020A2FCE1|nr:GGDEF domain-containing protein [Treponema denticola]UTC81718.1 GGDEF domain-containing protein [Treponema denticola]